MEPDKTVSKILIIKTSSLGDIVQSFIVLDDLKRRFPNAKIDWALEATFAPIVASHPLVSKTIALDIKGKSHLWQGLKKLREEKYDLVFDLQANCKSGVITWLAKGKIKVGYSFDSVREWPNILATHKRFSVSRQQNIRLFYLELIEKYFQSSLSREATGVRFNIENEEKQKIQNILQEIPQKPRIMVCPGSKWVNKQLKSETFAQFLQKVEKFCGASFLFIWGSESEKNECQNLAKQLQRAYTSEKLALPTWQNLMNEVDLVIAVDSSALHLCATTSTPSFSIFGPTSSHIFKPIGEKHFSLQGTCPYGRTFEKQCPVLRSCPTGACIRDLKAESLFQAFQSQCGFLQP